MRSVSNIKILYEDGDIVAIDKPAGISVHGDGKSSKKTISDWVLKKYPEAKDVGEPVELANGNAIQRHGIVHRLDKETSGVLLIAKTQEGYWHLKKQFKDRKVKKTYHVFIYGKMRDERGIIDRPIGRATGSVRKWACSPRTSLTGDGRRATGNKTRGEMREAVTKFKVVKSVMPASLLEVWPQTGRTHQIRVHMQALGHPVVADSLYAPSRESVYGFKRLALHAKRLIFNDLKGNLVEVESPFPTDFKEAMKEIGL